MNFENIIDIMLTKFPCLEERYIEEGDYIEGLAHLCFGIVFVPYVEEIYNNGDMDELSRVGSFLETMLSCDDELVQELAVVSFIENIIYNKKLVSCLRNYTGEHTDIALSHFKDELI